MWASWEFREEVQNLFRTFKGDFLEEEAFAMDLTVCVGVCQLKKIFAGMHSTLTHSTGTSQGLPHIRFYVGLCWGPDLTLIGFHFKGGSPFGVYGGTHGQRVFQPR